MRRAGGGRLGKRPIYDTPEVWLGQVDVELPGGERIWHHVVRLNRAAVMVLVDDQALRTGRLARRDPNWTPARTGYGLIRDPATLAPSADDITIVLGAVHHAADAITRIAAEDRDAVRQAAADKPALHACPPAAPRARHFRPAL